MKSLSFKSILVNRLKTFSIKVQKVSFYSIFLNSKGDFEKLLHKRRNEAQRTVLVQLPTKATIAQAWNELRCYGEVEKLYSYKLKPQMIFLLVEYNSTDTVKKIVSKASFVPKANLVPITSRFLFFNSSYENSGINENFKVEMPVIYEDKQETESQIYEELHSIPELNLQHAYMVLGEVGTRLRFLICQQIEDALYSLFPNCCVLPFGSSVNGLGQHGCDLDMTLELCPSPPPPSNFFFQNQAASNISRVQIQRYMELIADVIAKLLPGCTNVTRILRARVPIIKYYQELVGVECDLTMQNTSGVHMSELLWLYGELDKRVRPLVLAVRRWAELDQLTNDIPGNWITNFTLTLLVLFFLQNRPVPIILPFEQLRSLATPEDKRRASDGPDCTFIRQLSKIPVTENNESLDELLAEFFEFYMNFNWRLFGISLLSGSSMNKPDSSPLYVQNPLQPELNVSRNVSRDELFRIQESITNALWRLQTSSGGLLALYGRTCPPDGFEVNKIKKLSKNKHEWKAHLPKIKNKQEHSDDTDEFQFVQRVQHLIKLRRNKSNRKN